MTKEEYEEQDDIQQEMTELALAEPEPPEWEWYDPDHPTADAMPPEWYLDTTPMEWMEQELLELQYKEEQGLDALKAYGIPQDGKLAKTEPEDLC